jgi:uncharacterized membrane protein YphA (DoxX/SURF4 family)
MRMIQTALSWLLALFIAAVFVQAAIMFKLYDSPGENVLFATIAAKSGLSIFEPTVRFGVGIAEVVAAFFLLFPFTRRFGAFLTFCLMMGAIGFHLSPWLGQEVPTALGSVETDGGALFYLALATLLASLVLMVIHPKPEKKRRF